MRHEQSRKGRSGFTLIELLVVVAIIALLISILLPSLARARELAKRTTCAANLSGIGKGLHTYSNDGNQGMPVAAHVMATTTSEAPVQYWGKIGSKRGLSTNASMGEIQYYGVGMTNPDAGVQMSNVRNLWTLVRVSGSTPASFVCPSSEDAKNDEDNPQAYWDFGKGENTAEGMGGTPTQVAATNWAQVSYGYQTPWGQLGKPSADRDQRVIMVADKGPYSAWIEGGKTRPTPWNLTTMTSTSSPDVWRKFNSPNHGGLGDGEGQNVLGADGHADWYNKPTAGPALDNIYTHWSSGTPTNPVERVQGTDLPGTATTTVTAGMVPWGETDAFIYP